MAQFRVGSSSFASQRLFVPAEQLSPSRILRLHTLRRVGKDDVLFAVISRDGDTDAIYQWYGVPTPSWQLVYELPGTNLIYDSVTWQERVHLADGKNPILRFGDELDCFDESPVVQYLAVFQDRLFGAGDARLIPSEVAEVDSNRNMVRFCEVLDFEHWLPNNFISADTGTGESISGLGVNSITSSDRGAQGQLVVFKPSSTFINDGVINSNEQRLNVVSKVVGCPGYNTIKNTPFGLMFVGQENVYLMNAAAKEPDQIGTLIGPEIKASGLKSLAAAYFHDNCYKLSISAEGGTTNSREWWLDLRQGIFPEAQLWYGPHTGDRILQYEVFNGALVAAEHNTTNIWRVDVEGVWGSMTDSGAARTSIMTWGRFSTQNMKRGFLDAYGFQGTISRESSGTVQFDETVDFEGGIATASNTFDVAVTGGVDKSTYAVIRPVRRTAYDAQVSISHDDASDCTVDSLYVRSKIHRRQSERGDE